MAKVNRFIWYMDILAPSGIHSGAIRALRSEIRIACMAILPGTGRDEQVAMSPGHGFAVRGTANLLIGHRRWTVEGPPPSHGAPSTMLRLWLRMVPLPVPG